MKKFNQASYSQYIRRIIPGYELMQNIAFNAVLPDETLDKDVKEILALGSQLEEIQHMHAMFPEARITVVEPSEVMVDFIKEACSGEEYKNVRYICDYFENVKLDTEFDLCVCMLVFHFVEKIDAFLDNLGACLKEDAPCILSVFTNEQMNHWKNFSIHSGANPKGIEATYQDQGKYMGVYSSGDVLALLEKHGFHKITDNFKALNIVMYDMRKN